MFNRIHRIFMKKQIYLTLFILLNGLLLSACSGKVVSFNKDEWTPDYSNCVPCLLYKTAFNGLEKAISSIIEVTCSVGMTVLGFGLLFWMLFKVTSLFTLKNPNLKSFITQVFTVFFKAMIVAVIIYNPQQYIHFIGYYMLQPLFMFFADISRVIMTGNDVVSQSFFSVQEITGENVVPAMDSLLGDATTRILDIIYRIFSSLYTGIGLGLTILRQSGFIAIIFGLIILIMFSVLVLYFPLLFIDALIQIIAIIALSPFIFISWIFPATKGVFGKVWNVLLGALLNILFGCIYISIVNYVLILFSERTFPGIFGTARQTMDPMLEMEMKSLSINFLSFFVLIVALGFMSSLVPKLASHFSAAEVQAGGLFKSVSNAVGVGVKVVKTGARLAMGVAGGAAAIKSTAKKMAAKAKKASKK